MKITAVIPTLNEEDRIEECLESVEWVDEILVVDSYSDDRTVEIAESYGARVIREESKGYMEPHRISGIEKAENNWILRIDADEKLSSGLKEFLKDFDGKKDVIKAPRLNFLGDEKLKKCGFWPDYTPILFNRESVELEEVIHSSISFRDEAEIEKVTKKEEYSIIHSTYENLNDWISTVNHYTSIEAEQDDSKPSIVFEPTKRFIFLMLFRGGYKIGRRGLIFSFIGFFYTFLRESKKFYLERLGK